MRREIGNTENIILTKYPTLLEGTQVVLFKEISRIKSRMKSISINKDAAQLLSSLNGLKTIPEILRNILKRVPHPEEVSNTILFIDQLVKKGVATFFNKPKKVEIEIKNRIDAIYPQVINLELTNKCNFTCSYCYQNSSSKEDKFLKNPLELLEFLKNLDVIGLELSGGEPLMHPQVEKIITYILDNFSLLGIITNGSLLRERYLDLLHSEACRVSLQVCLDGNEPEIVEKTTGVKNSFEMEIAAIKRIKKHGFTLRVGMVIDTPEKIDMIENTLLIAKELGADSFVPNLAIDFGRGKDVVDRFKPEDYLHLNNTMQELAQKYKGFFSREGDALNIDYQTLHNCGAGHKNCVINWNGVIKPCPLISADDLAIGHWEGMSTEKMQESFKAYFDLEAPRAETCGNCSYFPYCGNCTVRGLKASEKNIESCAWYKKNKKLIERVRA